MQQSIHLSKATAHQHVATSLTFIYLHHTLEDQRTPVVGACRQRRISPVLVEFVVLRSTFDASAHVM